MGERERVVVAMSGGVDSSLTAALLMEQGYEAVGVTFHLWDAEGARRIGRCCTPEDRHDARRVCDRLGIPHYVIDQREAFRQHVVDPFLDEYERGRTPSPCVHCNRHVKLGHLLEVADGLGARWMATGHYARVERDPSGRASLLRGLDPNKDQSYFLFSVEPRVLERLVLPLGGLGKDTTRARAREAGLPVADKPDSQELCFMPDGDIGDFAERQGRLSRPGMIKDETGRVLGEHPGIERFTVGQRRGLGLGGQAQPRYVLRVVPESAEVIVGPAERLQQRSFRATEAHWIAAVPDEAFEARVQIRHGHRAAPARVTPTGDGGGFEVQLTEPQRAITPGQAAVLYRGQEVLGGGFIA